MGHSSRLLLHIIVSTDAIPDWVVLQIMQMQPVGQILIQLDGAIAQFKSSEKAAFDYFDGYQSICRDDQRGMERRSREEGALERQGKLVPLLAVLQHFRVGVGGAGRSK